MPGMLDTIAITFSQGLFWKNNKKLSGLSSNNTPINRKDSEV
jgi:hypothetical protein